ncbi:hypothetical protein AB0G15_05725 [Streptosporangium sp. NPDC023825]|uniref:hypothetical protein n=1 Tax=Streptosporangium sp. NPDC023825 TaxID=3154909 RepID=UPI00344060F0
MPEEVEEPFDLWEAALPTLTEKAKDNPRLSALLEEYERGLRRVAERENDA